MATQRLKPSTNEIYHVYNRGVEKRKVFLDDKDHLRFIHDLFEFNDTELAFNVGYHFFNNRQSTIGVKPQYVERKSRKFLVEIQSFCLMPNHFHLLLRQNTEDGIPLFMKKLSAGYTAYFNQKYKRVGGLFQGVYKHALIKSEAHFIHLPYYIHMNPLDLITPEWREREMKNYTQALQFLEHYRWSSFLDYIGKKNFPSVTQREFLSAFLGEPQNYKKETIQWLKNFDESQIESIVLEKKL